MCPATTDRPRQRGGGRGPWARWTAPHRARKARRRRQRRRQRSPCPVGDFAPHPAATPVGTRRRCRERERAGRWPAARRRASAHQVIGPSAGLGRHRTTGNGRPRHRRSRPSSQVEPSEIASQIGVASPQPSGVSGRGGRGDGQLEQILSGGGSGAAAASAAAAARSSSAARSMSRWSLSAAAPCMAV